MREPLANLLLCFLLGIAAAFLSKWLYVGPGWFDLRYDALAKLLPFVVIVLRLKAFDEPMDGIIYASFIALGTLDRLGAPGRTIDYWLYIEGIYCRGGLARIL